MQPTPESLAAEFARLHEVLSTFEAYHAEGPEPLARRAPEVSGWSVEQHLYHIALATDLSLSNVRSLAKGSGALVREEGELGQRAAEVLARDEQPRGVAEAPRMVRPGETVNPVFLGNEQAGNRRLLEQLEAQADAILAAPGWITHQDLGPLQAAHWLRFSALHARHHAAIVRDVIAALG
jgi:hypothetical protein